MRHHEDERREFYGDLFSLLHGDLNVVKFHHRRRPIAWHRHQHQTDRIFVAQGTLRVGIIGETREFVVVPMGGTITIPPNHWHGYESIGRCTIIVQFNGPGKYDGSDEERHPINEEMPWANGTTPLR